MIAFEDVHEFPGNGDFYPTPNENLELWDRLLQGLRLYKVAGICSGGEVGFFNLLPRVQRELVLLDHSYKALYFAAVKYLVLQKYGPDEAYARLTAFDKYEYRTTTPGSFRALAAEVEAEIPEVLCTNWAKRRPGDYDYYTSTSGTEAFERRASDVATFWQRQKKDALIKTCAKLHKVTFMHGDLTDLAKKGKFGLVYLSNALESNHRNRNRTVSVPAQVAECLKPEGFVLTSHSGDQYATRVRYPDNWELVSEAKHTDIPRQGGDLNWTYQLRQVHPVAA